MRAGLNRFKHIRTGILHFNSFPNKLERCNKHKKVWEEGDNFEENGGNACRECIEKSKRDKRYKL